MQYTELHLHSYYSLLDGLNSPKEYLERAAELGMTHLALTDHGVLSGHREFQKHAKELGITPILGCEMYISPTDRFDRRPVKKREDNTQAYHHLIALAQNQAGYENLNKLSELAWTEGFYSKPRIDMDILEEYNEGLIVLSGCLNGLISKAITNDQPALADSLTREFVGIFGDKFFMELQHHNGDKVNDGLIALARKHGVRPVVTSDCHYAREEDLWVEQAMLIISSNPKPAKDFDFNKAQKMDILERFNYTYPDRTMNFEEFDLFMHSAEDHLNGYLATKYGTKFVEECLDNTMIVANMVEPYEYYEGLDLLPKRGDREPRDILWDMVVEGAKARGTYGKPEYDARRKEEMDVISAKDFEPYFVVLGETLSWGKDQGIRFGPGRGSGAGSLVMYEIGATEVDPIKYGLLFFRFINPDRNDYPDADTDVEVHRRSDVKQHLEHKYGNVASIATFGTFQGKNSIRDAARAFMVPLGDVNRALKGADWPSNVDWFEEWDGTEKGKEFKRKYPDVVKLAKLLYGRIKSQGMHAGGVVLSSEPIAKYAPMQTAKDNSDESGTRIPLIALDMEQAAEVGFIKYDFLGLKALSIITDTVNKVKERHGTVLDMTKVGLEDPKIYRELSGGWTKGIFQCEAVPYTNLILKMGGLRSFDDLVASNALVRPGAANSSAGARYIARNKGEEMVEYHHPLMQPFTKNTYGTCIFQEQVMLTMTELAGMDMGTADKIRKIIGKKRDVSEFEAYKAEFIEGASKNVPEKIAEQLWHDFEAHAGYSFNQSHAVAYSMLSYWTAWLKLNYPLEFMWAVLKNEKDKDALLDYLIEAKRMGIRVKLPHVNHSEIDFSIERDEKGEALRFGLSNIKYISGKIGSRLVDYRPFANYNDLYEKVMEKGSGLSTRTLSSLNAIGAAVFPDNPLTGQERDNFFEYLNIPAFETREIPPKVRVQFRQLDEFSQEGAFVCMGMVRGMKSGPGWTRIEIVDESGSAGVFTNEHHTIESGQMYIFLIADNRIVRNIKVEDFDIDSDDALVRYLANDRLNVPEDRLAVVSFSSRVTKAGKKMASVVFSDADKNLTSALVFPQAFMRCFALLREGKVVEVELKETKEGTLFVDKVVL